MVINFKAIIKYLVKKYFLYIFSFFILLLYVSFGLVVREFFVSTEENRKIIFDMITFAIAFYLSAVGFFVMSKGVKKTKVAWKKTLGSIRFIFVPISLFYLVAIVQIVFQNIDNIISELIYIKDFVFPYFESLLSKRTGLSQFLFRLLALILALSLVTIIIPLCLFHIDTKIVLPRFYVFKQKSANDQVINTLEIKGFLYKALP
ncbi:MAG: hypothetical protein PHS54_07145 [Clostridia bacterium]|nr:hypothetical protein [Clostridia bacterium]